MAGSRQGAAGFGGRDVTGMGAQTDLKKDTFFFFFSQITGTTHSSGSQKGVSRCYIFFFKLIKLNSGSTYQQQETETTVCVNTSQADISPSVHLETKPQGANILKSQLHIYTRCNTKFKEKKKKKFNCQSNSMNNLTRIMARWKAGCRKSTYFLTK